MPDIEHKKRVTKLPPPPDLSDNMEQFLRDQVHESEIEALIDAAREAGVSNYSREEAEEVLKRAQVPNKKWQK